MKGLRRKVWNQTKIFIPNILYFVAILRFVAIHAIFGRLWSKTVFFWARNALSDGIYCLPWWYRFANYAQNTTKNAKIANTRPTKICMAIFALAKRLPTSAIHPGQWSDWSRDQTETVIKARKNFFSNKIPKILIIRTYVECFIVVMPLSPPS